MEYHQRTLTMPLPRCQICLRAVKNHNMPMSLKKCSLTCIPGHNAGLYEHVRLMYDAKTGICWLLGQKQGWERVHRQFGFWQERLWLSKGTVVTASYTNSQVPSSSWQVRGLWQHMTLSGTILHRQLTSKHHSDSQASRQVTPLHAATSGHQSPLASPLFPALMQHSLTVPATLMGESSIAGKPPVTSHCHIHHWDTIPQPT